jgi:hypothetical protein
MRKLLVLVMVLIVACPLILAQDQKQAQEPSDGAYLDAYVEMARSDLRTQKTAIITQAVPMTDKESAAFWPVYRKYDLELNQLGDKRVALIKDYANSYNSGVITEAKAKELADRALAWEGERVALKKKYYAEFTKVLPAVKATRLMQVESRIALLIDLQIASGVPLVN